MRQQDKLRLQLGNMGEGLGKESEFEQSDEFLDCCRDEKRSIRTVQTCPRDLQLSVTSVLMGGQLLSREAMEVREADLHL